MTLEVIKAKIFDDVNQLKDAIKSKGKVVFTNGCFDVFHNGHLHSLIEARGLGDFLIIGLNSDSSVHALKGKNRPINSQEERAELLASLNMVDAVIIFEENRPTKLIDILRPHIYAKGAEYDMTKLDESKKVISYGGKLHQLRMKEGLSSTLIISKI